MSGQTNNDNHEGVTLQESNTQYTRVLPFGVIIFFFFIGVPLIGLLKIARWVEENVC